MHSRKFGMNWASRPFVHQLMWPAAAVSVAGSLMVGLGGSAAALASTNKATPPTVNIAMPTLNITDAPVLIAEALGYYAKNGVNVTTTQVNGSSVAEAALLGGSASFITVATPAIFVAIHDGLPLESVETMLDGAAEQLVVSKSYLAAHHIKTSGTTASKTKALLGSKWALVSTTDKSFFNWLLVKANLHTSQFSTISISSTSSLIPAMQGGLVDEWVQSPPITYQAQAEGIGKVFINTPPQWKNLSYFQMVTTRNFAASNPTVTKAVATATAEGNQYIQTHRSQAEKILQAKYFPSISLGIIKESVSGTPFSPNGLQSQTAWTKADNLEVSTGLISQEVPVNEGGAWTNQFIAKGK